VAENSSSGSSGKGGQHVARDFLRFMQSDFAKKQWHLVAICHGWLALVYQRRTRSAGVSASWLFRGLILWISFLSFLMLDRSCISWTQSQLISTHNWISSYLQGVAAGKSHKGIKLKMVKYQSHYICFSLKWIDHKLKTSILKHLFTKHSISTELELTKLSSPV
jgi:hypothetical protein